MACCRYNRTGRCRNCMCAKRGHSCQGCFPQRLGNCVNIVQTRSSASAPVDMPTLPPSSLNIVPETPPSRQPLTMEAPATSQVLSSSFQQPSCPGATISELLPHSSSIHAPENNFVLPQFSPMADPVFTWGEYDSLHFTDSLCAAYAEACTGS